MIVRGGLVALCCAALLAACSTYRDDLGAAAIAQDQAAGPILIETRMALEDGHSFPVEILLPARPGSYPLIVFSSGNFASPDRYARLLKPIAEAGYVIASPVHLDAEVLALDPPADPLTIWQRRNDELAYLAGPAEPLQAALARHRVALEPGQIGVMGHSYGALIAQTAAGANAWQMGGAQPSRKIAGADVLVAFSPPGPVPGAILAEG